MLHSRYLAHTAHPHCRRGRLRYMAGHLTCWKGSWDPFAAAESVQVLGRLHEYPIDRRGGQASEKRFGAAANLFGMCG